MNKTLTATIHDPRVTIRFTAPASAGSFCPSPFPAEAGAVNDHYSDCYSDEALTVALDRLSQAFGWNDQRRGSFGRVIPEGARVLIKPNFVLHENQGGFGLAPLVTHPALVRVVTEAALRAGAGEVIVGDAPVQGCDFAQLLRATKLDE
jgi:hypothetical protein